MAARVLQPHQHSFVTTLRRWCAWDLNDALDALVALVTSDALVTNDTNDALVTNDAHQ